VNKSASKFAQFSALKAAGLYGHATKSHVVARKKKKFQSPLAIQYSGELNQLAIEIFGKACKHLSRKELKRLAEAVNSPEQQDKSKIIVPENARRLAALARNRSERPSAKRV
jgi:hypothetical protein